MLLIGFIRHRKCSVAVTVIFKEKLKKNIPDPESTILLCSTLKFSEETGE